MAARTADGVFSITPRAASCSPRWAIGRAMSQSSEVHTALGYLEGTLDFDGRIDRQRGDADRGARVFALVAEHRDHQVGGAVHHFRAIEESRRRVYEAAKPHNLLDLVEVADGSLHLVEKADGARACRLLPVLDRYAGTKLALRDELAVTVKANLAGDGEQIAGAHVGHIIGNRFGRLLERNAELFQLAFHRAGHRSPPRGL